MLACLSRELRLALVLALGVGFVAADGHRHPVYAEGDEDEGDTGDEEGGDDGGKGGGEEDDGEEAEDAKDQPPVTAGGLFTLATYPVRELSRPLTMTKGITQVRVGLGTDIS